MYVLSPLHLTLLVGKRSLAPQTLVAKGTNALVTEETLRKGQASLLLFHQHEEIYKTVKGLRLRHEAL